MPSVPLIRASPSFSAKVTGARPCVQGAGGGDQPIGGVAHVPFAHHRQGDVGQWEPDPEQPRLPYSCTTGVSPADSRSA